MGNAIQSGIYKIIIVSLLVIVGFSAFGQVKEKNEHKYVHSFVITNTGDTIIGKVKITSDLLKQSDYSEIEFVDSNFVDIEFNMDSIYVLGRGSAIYVKIVDNSSNSSFLQLIEDGSVKLFINGEKTFASTFSNDMSKVNESNGNETPSLSDNRFYIEYEDSHYKLKVTNYKEKLASLLGNDWTDTTSKFKYADIPERIKDYNTETDSEVTKYQHFSKILSDNQYGIRELDMKLYNSDKEKSYYEIMALKEGAIIVRLKSGKRKIDAYTNAGMIDKAEEIKQKYIDEGFEIMNGFSKYYDFCPVYFIKAEDYGLILNDIKSGYFLDESTGEIDSSIVFNEKYFFFLDRGPVYEQVMIDQNKPKLKEASSNPIVQDAFVLKDKDLNQLLDPFPLYTPIRLHKEEEAILKLNKRHHEYYVNPKRKINWNSNNNLYNFSRFHFFNFF